MLRGESKKIVLQFQPRTGASIDDLIGPDTYPEHFVVGMLTDCRTWYSANRFLEEVRAIVAGRLGPISGSGNMYYTGINKDTTLIELPDGQSVTVPTDVVLDALEQWVAYLAREYPGSGIPISQLP